MGSKRKACKADHPELNTRCWSAAHEDSDVHWAYVSDTERGKGVIRIEWSSAS